MDMKNRIQSIKLLSGTRWEVHEEITPDAFVSSIYEVFNKIVPMYRVEYSNGCWFEIPVSSVEFVSGYMK